MSKEKFVRDKPHVNIGTIILTLFVIISMGSLGMMIYSDIMETRDSDGDSIPDLEEDIASSALFFDISDDTLFFRTYETGTSGHEVGHNLGLSHDGLSSHVNVRLGLFDDVSAGIPILDFNIKYDSLIEFVDSDSNGFFDPAIDTIIGKTTLDNMLRLGFGFGVEGEPAYYSSYSTIDGVFHVDFYTAREHVLLGRQVGLLSPSELKSYITFTEYTPITGGTQLALNLSLSSSHDITFSGTTLSAISSIGNYKVEYEWYNWAIIDDVETKVNTTVPSSPIPLNIGSIYINFGEVINGTYDPKLYWQIPRPTSFTITDLPWSYITIGSIGVIAVGAAAKIQRGKKKSKEKPKPKPPTNKFDMIATSVQSTAESEDHIPRKRPGRVKYGDIPPSPKDSPEKSTKSEKRIPSTLRHRNR
ncbi:MAG: hypothetical protein ACFFAK_09625 [Promethearchaeota archaeon]